MRINVNCLFFISAILFASIIFVCNATKVNVMLSLTTVNKDCKLNQPEKLMGQLRQLKSGGVDGIMVDVWWGIVEQSPKQYKFDGYVELVKMAYEIGLKVQFVASFHQCGGNVGDECSIDLPSWVLNVGQKNKSVFYTDQYGDADPEYISLGANNARIFNGRTPLDIYRDFFIAMTETFRPWMPRVIDEIQVGLGPTGELRYPGYQMRKNKWTYCGIGEFQCYDGFMLESLKKAALKAGHPEWSNRGPSNAGNYNSRPYDTGFFSGGFDNYDSPYGRFFLNWYFEQLKDHGRAVLKRAKDAFSPLGVSTAAKIAGIHWWYDHASHAAEVTTGYYNTGGRNAYYELAQVLAETNTAFCFTCLEMRNQDYCASRPETLIHQTMNAAFENNIPFSGENAIDVCEGSCRQHDFDQIVRQTRSMRRPMKHFTYLRLRDSLLAGNNWNMFVNFVNEMHRAN